MEYVSCRILDNITVIKLLLAISKHFYVYQTQYYQMASTNCSFYCDSKAVWPKC